MKPNLDVQPVDAGWIAADPCRGVVRVLIAGVLGGRLGDASLFSGRRRDSLLLLDSK
jgi:hypothetical protein